MTKKILLIGVFVGLVFSLSFFFYFNSKSEIASAVPLLEKEKAKEKVGVSLPVRLKIPKIHIDAPVEQVGLTSAGAVGVPKGPREAAWFNVGPRPGEPGSAVIDGHSGWRNNTPAVFDNLYKLKEGDKIYVQDENGVNISFVVRDIKSYDPKAYVPGVFASSDGLAHLNLITCGGVWNATKKTHSHRLVVFTDKE